MSKLSGMYKAVMDLAKQTMAEPDEQKSYILAGTCQQMAQAYQTMRDVELHEEYIKQQNNQEGAFQFPGEGFN